MIKLPQEFEVRMKVLLKDEYDDFLDSYNKSNTRAFRVNTDKISLEKFQKINCFSDKKIPFVENGFYTDFEHIGNHPFHHAGMIYVQEPAAMAPAECVDIEKDWHILDMCAAPGGKSTQLKNKLGPEGVLVSNEIIPSRCKILTGNIERLGLNNCVTTCLDTKRLSECYRGCFDLVMVDAPCSGEGMFRKDPNAINEWSLENVYKCAERQKVILENAAKAVKNGGYIIYSTCTFSLEENEMVVDEFLSLHPEFSLCEVKKEVKDNTSDGICFEGCKNDMTLTRRFYPHKSPGEGQFMAVLKNCNNSEYFDYKRKPEKADKIVIDFLNDVLTNYDESYITFQNGRPVYFTPDFEIIDGTAFSCGITIGEIKKNYILPHHQFFMGLGNQFKRKIELDPQSDKLNKYLHGEEISVDCESGWAVITVCGCTLGGVKVVNGIAKNHYPKGLRLV